jgi:hypothetical protein
MANAARARASERQIASASLVVALEPLFDVEIEAGQPVICAVAGPQRATVTPRLQLARDRRRYNSTVSRVFLKRPPSLKRILFRSKGSEQKLADQMIRKPRTART